MKRQNRLRKERTIYVPNRQLSVYAQTMNHVMNHVTGIHQHINLRIYCHLNRRSETMIYSLHHVIVSSNCQSFVQASRKDYALISNRSKALSLLPPEFTCLATVSHCSLSTMRKQFQRQDLWVIFIEKDCQLCQLLLKRIRHC